MDEEKLSKLIGQLSSEALRAYVEVFLEENPNIAGQFCKFVDRQLAIAGVYNAEMEVENSFKAIIKVGSRWGGDWIKDWERISKDCGDLFARALDATAAGNPDIALATGVRWLEKFAEDYNEEDVYYYDDEDVYLGYDCREAAKVIDAAMAHACASEGAKKDAARRLEELSNRAGTLFSRHRYLDLKALTTRVNALSRSDEEALEYLGHLLESDFDNTALIIQKYKLLKKTGRRSEADAFIEENTDNREAADFYVSDLLEDKRYDKLIATLNDITDPEYNHHNHYLSKWLETLASVFDRIGQADEATAVYRRLFIYRDGDLKYYRILKARVETALWPGYLKEMMNQTKFAGSIYCGQCNYADILVEEGLYPQLHDWLEEKAPEAFSHYLQKVPEAMRADLIPIYSKLILKAASYADNRYAYAGVCSHLEKLKELPDGLSAAQDIAAEIRNNYSRRPAFMDELRNIMGR